MTFSTRIVAFSYSANAEAIGRVDRVEGHNQERFVYWSGGEINCNMSISSTMEK